MPNYFFTDSNGNKQGPFTEQQLQTMAVKGVITPNTALETDGGHRGFAGQIHSLKFNTATSPPITVPTQVTQVQSVGAFCTNCGNSVSTQAVVCMSCGAKPVGHRRFCRHCGAGLNLQQVICVKCGVGIAKTSGKSRVAAAILAACLGGLGVHKFYLGNWGWGIVFLLFCWTYIPTIISLVEFVLYLRMTDEAFAEKYSPETKRAFRW